MKLAIIALVATSAFAAPAFAWEGKVVACYDKVLVPATYHTTKELVKPAKTKWEHRNGQMVKVAYPPVYVEHKSVKTPEHYVMKAGACK